MKKTVYNEKSKERTMRYMKESRDRITMNFPKGNKERYKEFAERQGKSLTSLFVDWIESEISKEKSE